MATASLTGKPQSGRISISTDEYESVQETVEVLSDIDIMKQLEEGKKDSTKVIDFEDLAEELVFKKDHPKNKNSITQI